MRTSRPPVQSQLGPIAVFPQVDDGLVFQKFHLSTAGTHQVVQHRSNHGHNRHRVPTGPGLRQRAEEFPNQPFAWTRLLPVTQQDSRRQRKAGEEMAHALRLYGYFTLSSVFPNLSAEALTPKATVFGDGLYGGN